jgi:hypothetical protein
MESYGGMILAGENLKNSDRNLFPVPLRPPQIPLIIKYKYII